MWLTIVKAKRHTEDAPKFFMKLMEVPLEAANLCARIVNDANFMLSNGSPFTAGDASTAFHVATGAFNSLLRIIDCNFNATLKLTEPYKVDQEFLDNVHKKVEDLIKCLPQINGCTN